MIVSISKLKSHPKNLEIYSISNIEDLQHLSTENYALLFKNSSMKRTKISGLKRNIEFINN